jgi:hypothetical protein
MSDYVLQCLAMGVCVCVCAGWDDGAHACGETRSRRSGGDADEQGRRPSGGGEGV